MAEAARTSTGEAAVNSEAELRPLPVAGGGAMLVLHGCVGCSLCPVRILRLKSNKVFFLEIRMFYVCGGVRSPFKSKCENHCCHFFGALLRTCFLPPRELG